MCCPSGDVLNLDRVAPFIEGRSQGWRVSSENQEPPTLPATGGWCTGSWEPLQPLLSILKLLSTHLYFSKHWFYPGSIVRLFLWCTFRWWWRDISHLLPTPGSLWFHTHWFILQFVPLLTVHLHHQPDFLIHPLNTVSILVSWLPSYPTHCRLRLGFSCPQHWYNNLAGSRNWTDALLHISYLLSCYTIYSILLPSNHSPSSTSCWRTLSQIQIFIHVIIVTEHMPCPSWLTFWLCHCKWYRKSPYYHGAFIVVEREAITMKKWINKEWMER